MKKGCTSFIILLISFINLIGQGSGLPAGNEAYLLLERLEIKTGKPAPFHTTLRPWLRGDLTKYAIDLDTSEVDLTNLDRQNLAYIFRDNNEWLGQADFPTTLTGPAEEVDRKEYIDSTKTFYRLKAGSSEANEQSSYYIKSERPILKYFYKTPANLFELNRPSFQLKLNPILNLKMAKDQNDSELVFLNQRGVEIRGSVDGRIHFYSNIIETQSRFPNYVNERITRDGAVPGAGLFKPYKSNVFNITNGYDYLNAQGYIGFNLSRHVGMQFGHGTNFIGNGHRSLLLSDFGNNYFYLKFNTKVWKLHYQNIFAELTADNRGITGDALLPKKYLAAHYLNLRITPKLSFGVFEAVVFSRNNNFELQYLNPLIFYRTVEGYIGSPDNVLIGANGKWNFLQRFQLYGQLMLDEFAFNELLVERRGWWANKYGIQLGLKYINTFGIDHLDTQIEFNSVRPYTYTHRDSSASYSHQNQALAHPLGANFKEYILKMRYQPLAKWTIDGRLLYFTNGEDSDTTNWGGNILLPHTTREMEFNNEIAQGIESKTLLLGLDVSYQIRHNIFLDLHYFYRRQDSADDTRDLNTSYFGGGFRMNIAQRKNDF